MTTQLFVKELKCSFNLRTPRSDKPSIIYMVIRLHGRQYKFSTGMKVYPTHWEPESQRAVTSGSTLTRLDCTNNSLANNRIEEFMQRFEEFKRHLLNSPDSETKLPERLRNFMQTGAAEVSDRELLHEAFRFLYPPDTTTGGTLRTNMSRLKLIDKYLTTATPYRLDQRLLDRFCDYLTERGSGVKQINECCGLLKRLINAALRIAPAEETPANKVSFIALRDKRRRDDTKKVCLMADELQALKEVPLPEKEDVYRRLFLMQTECGVRMSDLSALLEADFTEKTRCLTITTRKEGIEATVFISEDIRRMIDDYHKGRCRGLNMGSGFPTQYNKVLKRIARKAGLNREVRWKEQFGRRVMSFRAPLSDVISSHFARHTFITTRVREGWNSDKLRFLTGHADDTMIKRIYTHLTADDRQNLVMEEFRRLNPDFR